MASAFDIGALTKRRLQTQIFETLPKDRWYTTVVDKNALRVVSSHLKLSDLLEYNISVVDPLEISRKPGKDAVYIISPLPTSMRQVLEDFQGPKPLYESARIFFTSKASEELLQMLKSCVPLVKRLQALKEIHAEFENVDERTFSTGCPDALPTLFGRDMSREARQSELHKTAQRLATIFTTLKTRPNSIVVRTPTELPDLPNGEARRSVCRDLGTLVQKRLSKWSLADSNLFTGSGCDLIIVDRGHDPVAPVIHPFHYASITHDLVPMNNGVFKYTWKDAKGEEQSSEHIVDSTDSLWADLRHTHVAEVVEVANAKLKDFTNSRMARVEREGVANAKIGNATASLPEYLAKKAHLSMHVELTSSIFQRVNERDLISLGRLEQELVFGEKKSNDIILHLQGWNARRSSSVPTLEDIMRLLLCYFATHPGRLEPGHQEKWASVAHLSQPDMHNICNVQYLGVELQKAKKASMFSFKRRKANKALRVERSNDSRALDCGRFQPLIMDTFNEFVTSKLPTGPGKGFDIVPGNSEFDAIPQAPTSLGAKSVRTSNRPQPTWHRRAGSTGAGAASLDDIALRSRKVVMFVVGGCTWSEIQAVHELSQQHGVEVLLGSTNMINSGEDFLRDMGRLAPYGVATDAVAIEMGGAGSGPGSRQESRHSSGAGAYRTSR